MAGVGEDFFCGDDLDAIFAVIDDNALGEQQDNNLKEELDVTEAIKCTKCSKICLSKRGLSRHIITKHKDENIDKNKSPKIKEKMPEEILPPFKFKNIVEKCIAKLVNEECYPDTIVNELKNYIGDIEKIKHTYNIIKDVITAFNGDSEKFYPSFYKCIRDAENAFIDLSRNCSLLVGFEAANHVLAVLSGAHYENNSKTCDQDAINFSEKERSIIGYLSGYVFGKTYRSIRFSKTLDQKNIYYQQCLSFLLAGQYVETNELPEHKLVNTRDRMGLWKVTLDVIKIFSVAEITFQTYSKKCSNMIDSKEMAHALLKHTTIQSMVSNIRSSANIIVKKEIAMNLLEDLLSLYIRTRTYSFLKDKQQLHKMKSCQLKTKSLRKELKQKSSTLDHGH